MEMPDRESLQSRHYRPLRDLNTPATAGYQVRVSDETEDPAWDAFLARTPGGHYVQTSLWAQMKARSGWRATRVVIARGDRIMAGAQLLTHPLPLLGAIGYVPKGPLIAGDDPELPHLMIDALHRVAAARHVQYLAIQPAGNGQALAQRLLGWGFRPQPKLGTCPATVLIDLTQNPDDILARMKKRTRSNIRHAQQEGITVREGTASDLDTFYHLLVTASQRKDFPIYSKKYYAELWRVLAPHGHIKLFLAEYAGEAVSAQLALPIGDTLFTHVSAWSGRHGSCKPNEALEWAAILWAKAQGYHYYDFEGIDPEAARALLRGDPLPDSPARAADNMVTSYKLGFGGHVTLLPGTYDYIYNPLLRWVYRGVFPKIERWSIVTKARKTVSRLIQPRMARSSGPDAGGASRS